MAKTPAELWLLELERERYDRSYLGPSPTRYEPQVLHVTKVERKRAPQTLDEAAQKRRDQTMFHAGRFAQGARDQEAIDANLNVAKLITKKGTK